MIIFSYVIGSIFVSATILAGLPLKYFPPKKDNPWYGFKTKATSKNRETWVYGHKICANTLLIYSVFSTLLFVAILLIKSDFFNERAYLIIILGLLLALAGVIITTIIVQIKTIKYGKQFKE